MVPVTFRIEVSHRTQEPPSKFLPTALGIQRGASWRIRTGLQRSRPGLAGCARPAGGALLDLDWADIAFGLVGGESDGQAGGESQDHVLVVAEPAGQPQPVAGDLGAPVLVVADAFGDRAGWASNTCRLATLVTRASARSVSQHRHAAGQQSTQSSGLGDCRSVADCAPGCFPGRRRSDRSRGFFVYGLSEEGGFDEVEESLPRPRSSSATRPDSTAICAWAAASCASFASTTSRSLALASRSAATSARNSSGAASSGGRLGTSYHDR